jgi:hypothetical protein
MRLRDGYGVDDVLRGRRRANSTSIGRREIGKGEDGRGGDCDTEIFLAAAAAATTTGITVAAIVDNGRIIGRWEGSGGVVILMVRLACHGCNYY